MANFDDTYGKKRSKLKITQESVVKNIMFAIETDGQEQAKHFFDILNTYFSTEPGWPETAREVRELFAGLRKQNEIQKQAEKEAEWKLAEKHASMQPFMIVNKNEASGIKQIDQLNAGIEEGAEVTHTIHN